MQKKTISASNENSKLSENFRRPFKDDLNNKIEITHIYDKTLTQIRTDSPISFENVEVNQRGHGGDKRPPYFQNRSENYFKAIPSD